MSLITRLVRDENAQGMMEWALVAALIAVVVLVATKLVGTATNTMMSDIASQIG